MLAGCGGSPTTGTLRGRLVKGGGPLQRTRIVLEPRAGEKQQRLTATTNARGRFVFADVEQGSYVISLRYRIADVFECPLGFPAQVVKGETLSRRLEVPLIDVKPNGTAKLPKGRRTRCRTLRDPLKAFLCQGSQMPIDVFALPPRREMNAVGYRKLGAIFERSCGRVSVLGHLPGDSPLTDRPLGWLFVSVRGAPRLRGWVFPVVRRLGAQQKAWSDVAVARAARLPTPSPTLPGSGLSDLAFTTPREAQHVGDPCDRAGPIGAEWAVSVRNTGRGLGPKRFELFINNSFQTELRHLGDAAWVRGLAPGESVPIEITYDEPEKHIYLGLNAYTHLKLDPDNKVKESNEANNELALGYLPQLTCVAR